MMSKKSSIIFLAIAAAGFSVGILLAAYSLNQAKATPEPTDQSTTQKPAVPLPKPVEPSEPEKLPGRIVLNVPFYAQAPFMVWDEIHKEACEEASLHMVRDYYRKTRLDLEEQDQLILNFIRWQTDNGYKVDLTLKQLAAAARSYYGLAGGEIIADPTIEEIKQEIVKGHPVIVPAAGQLLDNPHFRSPGPVYHMVVIKGYDRTGFITNDPGTRHGEGFHYTYENLYQAIHDWNPLKITDGAKAVLVYR